QARVRITLCFCGRRSECFIHKVRGRCMASPLRNWVKHGSDSGETTSLATHHRNKPNMSNTGSNANNTNVVTSDSPAKLELTAYRGGQAVFREQRVVALIAGRNRVFLAGLPAQFDPH